MKKKNVFTVNIYRNGRGNWKQAESWLKMNWTKENKNSESVSEKMIVTWTERVCLVSEQSFFCTFVTQKNVEISLQTSIKKQKKSS